MNASLAEIRRRARRAPLRAARATRVEILLREVKASRSKLDVVRGVNDGVGVEPTALDRCANDSTRR